MIGLITGKAVGPNLVLTAGGVGYVVEVLSNLKEGTEVTLHTHAVYRENEASLYGFVDPDDRSVFVELLGVSGVGPKMAMSMLAKLGAGGVRRVFRDKDDDAVRDLMSVDGVGRKTAQKLLAIANIKTEGADESPKSRLEGGVRATLEKLGFNEAEIEEALGAVTDESSVGAAVRQALAGIQAKKASQQTGKRAAS